MAFTNETTHYGLPQWIGSDKPTYLVDQNNAYQKIDSEIYNANVAAGEAVTTANGASATAGAASSTAADALSAAQTASTTADNALSEAQTANTNAQAAQTAAGAAQTAAEAAQTAAAGNSITNLAPAYDSTIPYAIDDLVTQDGKLYKCIVAVTTPEQFDINKWDDVTTSEVYARAGNNLYAVSSIDTYTVPSDTSKTRNQFFVDAFHAFINNITSHLAGDEYIVINEIDFAYTNLIYENGVQFFNYNTAIPDFSRFSSITIIDPYISVDIIYYHNTATYKAVNISTADGSVTPFDKGAITNDTDMRFVYTIYKKI